MSIVFFPLIPNVWKIEKWQTTSEVSKTLLFVEYRFDCLVMYEVIISRFSTNVPLKDSGSLLLT